MAWHHGQLLQEQYCGLVGSWLHLKVSCCCGCESIVLACGCCCPPPPPTHSLLAYNVVYQLKRAYYVAFKILLCAKQRMLTHVLPLPTAVHCRLLAAYNARIADEGEYDEQELPASIVDDLEGAAGPARLAFAVSAEAVYCLM